MYDNKNPDVLSQVREDMGELLKNYNEEALFACYDTVSTRAKKHFDGRKTSTEGYYCYVSTINTLLVDMGRDLFVDKFYEMDSLIEPFAWVVHKQMSSKAYMMHLTGIPAHMWYEKAVKIVASEMRSYLGCYPASFGSYLSKVVSSDFIDQYRRELAKQKNMNKKKNAFEESKKNPKLGRTNRELDKDELKEKYEQIAEKELEQVKRGSVKERQLEEFVDFINGVKGEVLADLYDVSWNTVRSDIYRIQDWLDLILSKTAKGGN